LQAQNNNRKSEFHAWIQPCVENTHDFLLHPLFLLFSETPIDFYYFFAIMNLTRQPSDRCYLSVRQI